MSWDDGEYLVVVVSMNPCWPWSVPQWIGPEEPPDDLVYNGDFWSKSGTRFQVVVDPKHLEERPRILKASAHPAWYVK
jgi:hypothetical protein